MRGGPGPGPGPASAGRPPRSAPRAAPPRCGRLRSLLSPGARVLSQPHGPGSPQRGRGSLGRCSRPPGSPQLPGSVPETESLSLQRGRPGLRAAGDLPAGAEPWPGRGGPGRRLCPGLLGRVPATLWGRSVSSATVLRLAVARCIVTTETWGWRGVTAWGATGAGGSSGSSTDFFLSPY